MRNRSFVKFLALLCLLALALLGGGSIFIYNSDSHTPQAGDRYEIIEPVYIMGSYNRYGDKTISKETASAALHSQRYADKHIVAFQEQVPAGTIMTIISVEPDALHLPFFVPRRIVALDPDPSRGLEVALTLDRGMEGSLDGLNPELFRKLPPAQSETTEAAESGVEPDDGQ